MIHPASGKIPKHTDSPLDAILRNVEIFTRQEEIKSITSKRWDVLKLIRTAVSFFHERFGSTTISFYHDHWGNQGLQLGRITFCCNIASTWESTISLSATSNGLPNRGTRSLYRMPDYIGGSQWSSRCHKWVCILKCCCCNCCVWGGG